MTDLTLTITGTTGLASQHAYAVLDVVEACGRKLIKVRTPVSCRALPLADVTRNDVNSQWQPDGLDYILADELLTHPCRSRTHGAICGGRGTSRLETKETGRRSSRPLSNMTGRRHKRWTMAFSGCRGK